MVKLDLAELNVVLPIGVQQMVFGFRMILFPYPTFHKIQLVALEACPPEFTASPIGIATNTSHVSSCVAPDRRRPLT
ncbi:unnamed protein product [Caenorhabditis brenneri]